MIEQISIYLTAMILGIMLFFSFVIAPVVFTTLDEELQKYAEEALEYGLEEYDRRQGWRGAIKNIGNDGIVNWKDYQAINSSSNKISAYLVAIFASIKAERHPQLIFSSTPFNASTEYNM